MIECLKKLCAMDATSGDESTVRDFIIAQIKDYADYHIDNLGNIIAFKKGRAEPKNKIMLDAHMDEVGLIVTSITNDGFLKFSVIGGMDTAVLLGRRVLINGKISGVIGMRPIHLSKGDERKKLPKVDSLYIDIGADSKQEACSAVVLGDRAVVCSDITQNDEKLISKALDDRIGCAVAIDLIKNFDEYSFYISFSVQEEVGLRGARVSAFAIDPQFAIILEGTTAADIADVPDNKRVCSLGHGVAVSFMDNSTLYDKALYNAAINSGLNVQTKAAVSGGNNSGAVHLSREGVRTIALSAPCRYIHSAGSVCDINDIFAMRNVAEYMLKVIASGELM